MAKKIETSKTVIIVHESNREKELNESSTFVTFVSQQDRRCLKTIPFAN